MMEEEVFQYLGAGGDVGVIALLVYLARLDRRLVIVETTLKMIFSPKG